MSDALQASDPVSYFIREMEYHGKSERTLAAYERTLRRFESFLLSDRCPSPGIEPGEAGRRECMAWIHALRDDLAPSSVATYASYLHRFYAYMVRVDAFEDNPMSLVREEMTETVDADPTRRDLTVPDMRAFVARIDHPLDRALVVTLLKTGLRVGELCNLDLRDCNFEPVEEFGVTPRAAVADRPRSLYVDRSVDRGARVNGERRSAANKRRRSTVIPVDDELERVITRWLTVRPDTRSPAEPLFVSTREWGRRVTPAMVRRVVRDHARAVGWYREGAGSEENVTPHYFRHFFTTHLRDRTGDRGVVKYLRGDVASDIIDTYTHDWGSRVRDAYSKHIYSLLGGDPGRLGDA